MKRWKVEKKSKNIFMHVCKDIRENVGMHVRPDRIERRVPRVREDTGLLGTVPIGATGCGTGYLFPGYLVLWPGPSWENVEECVQVQGPEYDGPT